MTLGTCFRETKLSSDRDQRSSLYLQLCSKSIFFSLNQEDSECLSTNWSYELLSPYTRLFRTFECFIHWETVLNVREHHGQTHHHCLNQNINASWSCNKTFHCILRSEIFIWEPNRIKPQQTAGILSSSHEGKCHEPEIMFIAINQIQTRWIGEIQE